MAQRWTDAIDQDGPEPTEEILRQLQGAFIRKRRHGLHRIEIFATNEQFETLTTIMNTATNPRLQGTTRDDETRNAGRCGQTEEAASATSSGTAVPAGSTGPDLDRRSRAQKLLDGLVGGCSLALATGELPANGGLKPQVMVTIDHLDLYNQLTQTTTPGTGATQLSGGSRLPGTATATFTGPIHPNTIRKIACDADVLPVLLNSESRILDVGRTTRIFPPHIRQALNARDQGCTFPDCTLPAPWCEAHHITYWSNGGTTSTDNGTLLCSHHHHVIHKEQWTIDMTTGVPWFVPPPHIDPTPHTPQNLGTGGGSLQAGCAHSHRQALAFQFS